MNGFVVELDNLAFGRLFHEEEPFHLLLSGLVQHLPVLDETLELLELAAESRSIRRCLLVVVEEVDVQVARQNLNIAHTVLTAGSLAKNLKLVLHRLRHAKSEGVERARVCVLRDFLLDLVECLANP